MWPGVPSSASHQLDETVEAPDDEFGAKDYRAMVQLKPDNEARPLWVVSRV